MRLLAKWQFVHFHWCGAALSLRDVDRAVVIPVSVRLVFAVTPMETAVGFPPATLIRCNVLSPMMKIMFIAGFGPVPDDLAPSRKLYSDDLGITFNEYEGGYMHAQNLEGSRGFAIWPLSLAAQDCFGTGEWPKELPRPQAWLEFEVEDLKEASEEMKGKGYTLLLDSFEEPYGQTVSRFISPEGLLVGLVITPWLREPGRESP